VRGDVGWGLLVVVVVVVNRKGVVGEDDDDDDDDDDDEDDDVEGEVSKALDFLLALLPLPPPPRLGATSFRARRLAARFSLRRRRSNSSL
jgi:hypothetical protein